MSGLNRVSYIFSIAFTDFASEGVINSSNGTAIPSIGTNLTAPNIEFCRTIQRVISRSSLGRHWIGRSRVIRWQVRGATTVGPKTLNTPLPTETGFTIATKANSAVKLVGAVNPNYACLNFRRHLQGKIDVLAPDAGCEAIAGVVCDFYRFAMGAKGHGREDRPEYLFRSNRVCRRDVSHQSWRKVPPLLR